MNNSNPFVPQGSLLELQGKRRSRMKLAVGCVLVVSVTALLAMLIQGCKREAAEPIAPENTVATVDTNAPAMDTNLPPVEPTNVVTSVPPMPAPTLVTEAAGSEYVVVKGDTLAKIAKAHGVSLKALEAANPNVQPTKLHIKQKLVIPAPTANAPTATAPSMGGTGEQTYKVKSGDTLGHLAKVYGTTVKAIEAANNLTSSGIKVGQTLKIPAKTEAAAPAPAPVPVETVPAPTVPPVTAPAK
jgi:LysM repeat protein